MPQEPLNPRIIKFIKKHHILTLSTSLNNESYCCTCFYSFVEENNSFVITSDKNTKHVNDILQNNRVSGAIALETKIIGNIQGIQFTGNIYELNEDNDKKARNSYLKKFPFAILMETTLWSIEPDFIKLTDNRLGFGKKLIWNKSIEHN